MELEHLLARDGGVARAAYLRSRGVELAEIRACLRSGSLRPLRRGWYAAETADPKVVRAVRSGGVLSCVSALHHHDVWVPRSKDLHVRGRSHPCRQYGRPERELRAIDDPPIALRHAVRCLDEESIVVVCDSLLYKRRMSRAEITRELQNAPARIRRLPERCDLAESGTESIVRLRLRARNIRVRTQVTIPGIGRVDLLVGRLIIEVDGAQYHSDARSFEQDRRRDRRAVQLGYIVIRLTYQQVMHEWDAAEQAILAVIRRRDHRWPARRCTPRAAEHRRGE